MRKQMLVLALCMVPATVHAQTMTGFELAGVKYLTFKAPRFIKWEKNSLGSGAKNLKWTLQDAHATDDDLKNCKKMAPLSEVLDKSGIALLAFKREAENAFNLWADAADLGFTYVSEVSKADIIIASDGKKEGWAFADVVVDREKTGGAADIIVKGIICINPTKYWPLQFKADENAFTIFRMLVHEIGHLLGLDHPADIHEVGIMNYQLREVMKLNPSEQNAIERLYGRKKNPPSG